MIRVMASIVVRPRDAPAARDAQGALHGLVEIA
jgi:hypothetical protein